MGIRAGSTTIRWGVETLKNLWNEFKKFVLRGNVLDLAVGLILGMAFKDIVTSLVNDILTPPLGLLLGRVNFTDLFINLSGTSFASLTEAKEAGAATINYGIFINWSVWSIA